MAYTTADDIELAISPDILIQLSDDNQDGAEDEDVIAMAIAEAEAKINSALSSAYSVPISAPIPDIVRFAAMWLAICIMGARRGVLPEEYRHFCEFYENWLDDVKKGDASIPELTPTSGLPKSNTEEQERLIIKSRLDHDGNMLNPEDSPTIDEW